MSITHTQRGFAKIEIPDTRGCICRVQRSSADPLDAVWIFCDDPHGIYHDGMPSPHLDPEQCRQVAEALLLFAEGRDWPEADGDTPAHTLHLTLDEARHLLAVLRANRETGDYHGPDRAAWWARHEELTRRLAELSGNPG